MVRTLTMATPPQTNRQTDAKRKETKKDETNVDGDANKVEKDEVSEKIDCEFTNLIRGMAAIASGEWGAAVEASGDGVGKAIQGKISVAMIRGAAKALGIQPEQLEDEVGGGTGY